METSRYFEFMQESNPLIEVAQFVRDHSPTARVAVVFDLDSTLFCVSPRTESILRRLAGEAEFRAEFADAAAILKDVTVLPSDWGVKSVLEREIFKATFSREKPPVGDQLKLFCTCGNIGIGTFFLTTI